MPAAGAGPIGRATIAVRPERMRFVEPGAGLLTGRIESASYHGGRIIYRIAAEDSLRLLVKQAAGDGGATSVRAGCGVERRRHGGAGGLNRPRVLRPPAAC